MPQKLILTENAQKDLDDAYDWYETQEVGLGKEFARCIDLKISEIYQHPLHHQVVHKGYIRRALTSRFPFSIYFVVENDITTIFAILHHRRSPDFWRSRL